MDYARKHSKVWHLLAATALVVTTSSGAFAFGTLLGPGQQLSAAASTSDHIILAKGKKGRSQSSVTVSSTSESFGIAVSGDSGNNTGGGNTTGGNDSGNATQTATANQDNRIPQSNTQTSTFTNTNSGTITGTGVQANVALGLGLNLGINALNDNEAENEDNIAIGGNAIGGDNNNNSITTGATGAASTTVSGTHSVSVSSRSNSRSGGKRK
jgi:hypothetical protein